MSGIEPKTDASTTPDVRSRPGGRSMEVRGPNIASSSGQLHPGKPIPAPAKNSQQDSLKDSTPPAKPNRRSSTTDIQENSSTFKPTPRTPRRYSIADMQERRAAPTPAPRSPAVENKAASPKPALRCLPVNIQDNTSPPRPAPRTHQCFSTADIQENQPVSRPPKVENKEIPSKHVQQSSIAIQDKPLSDPKPAPRSPWRFATADIQEKPAASLPAPTSPNAGNDVSPKPVQQSSAAGTRNNLPPAPETVCSTPVLENDVPSGSAHLEIVPPLSPTRDNSDLQNASNSVPHSTASLRTPSRPDDPAPSESRSNNQFIGDENLSIWSSSIEIVRPLSTENICRICHESDQVETLISPCLCRGSLSLVHRTCLQHWLAESDSSSCELCRFIYITKRVPKYSVLGSMVAWVRQNRRQRKALLVDALGMIAFVPFATMITYVAAALADGIEYQESPSWTDVTIRFAIVTFISMMTTIDVAYATYWMLRAQHHFSSWYSWYRRNSDVTLLPHPQQ